MTQDDSGWENYYQKTQGRTPRMVLLEALDIIEKETPKESRNAIDLGCGAGIETGILLERGWDVLAIDSEPRKFQPSILPSGSLSRIMGQDCRCHSTGWAIRGSLLRGQGFLGKRTRYDLPY